MVFSSNIFLFFFLPLTLLLYYLCPRRFRNVLLLAVSLLFYAWGEPVYLSLMVFTILLIFNNIKTNNIVSYSCKTVNSFYSSRIC